MSRQQALSPEQQAAVIELYQTGRFTQVSLGLRFSVHRSLIGRILRDAGIVVGHGVNPKGTRRRRMKPKTLVSSYGHRG